MNLLLYLAIGILIIMNLATILFAMRLRVLARTGRAAAQEMCQLVGDAQRMLGRIHAVWLYLTPEMCEELLSIASKDSNEEWSTLHNPMGNPEREASKITHWNEKADERIAKYSLFIGQQGDDSRTVPVKPRVSARYS